jgi:hypothetical protein
MKTYQDVITKKTVVFNEDDYFVIKTRSGFNKKIVKRVFSHDKVDEAFKEFYSMPISKTYYKYLFIVPKNNPDSEKSLVLRMKGELSKFEVDNFHLKNKRVKGKMQYSSIGSLTRCPVSLSHALASEDFANYPSSMFKWTNQKIVYALLAYLFSLPNEQKRQLLMEADKELFRHKELSGYPIDELNSIKVDVVTKDDLL